jgi:hypothetical protein
MRNGNNLCQAGCKAYYGGERKHHKDCVHYSESFTKLYDDLIIERDDLLRQLNAKKDEHK